MKKITVALHSTLLGIGLFISCQMIHTQTMIELLPGQDYDFPLIKTCFTCAPDPTAVYDYVVQFGSSNKLDSSYALADDEDHPYLTSQDTVDCRGKMGCSGRPVYTLHIPFNAPPKMFYVQACGFNQQPLKSYLIKVTDTLSLHAGQTYSLPSFSLPSNKKLPDDTIVTLVLNVNNYQTQASSTPRLTETTRSNKTAKAHKELSTTTTYQIVIPDTAPPGVFTIDGYNKNHEKVKTIYTVKVYRHIDLDAFPAEQTFYKLPKLSSLSHSYKMCQPAFYKYLEHDEQNGWYLDLPSKNLTCEIDIFDTKTHTSIPAYQIFLHAHERKKVNPFNPLKMEKNNE